MLLSVYKTAHRLLAKTLFGYSVFPSIQFGKYVRVGVTRKSCDFLPQQCLTMLRYHVNKFNPFAKVLFCTMTKEISA